MNEKEDQLLIEVDEKFNDLFIKEDMIRESEKLPNIIKKSLEKGKLIDKEWNENNLNAFIKDCIDIENNIKKLNEIDENIKKHHLNKNIKIDFSLEDNGIKKILDKIKNIGEITINDEAINNKYNDFDINTKNPLYQLNNHSKAIICLILMKDGRLVSGSNDNSIMIYNKISYTPDLVIKEHDNPVLCIIQLSSGVLASSSEDKTIKLFKIDNDKYEILQILNYHTKAIWKIIELKDKSLASCSEDCSIIFYVKDNLEYKKEYSFRVDDNSYCSSMLQIKDNEICYSTNNKKIHFYDLLQKKNNHSLSNIPKYNGRKEWFIMISKELLLVPGKNKIFIVDINEYILVRIIELPDSQWTCGVCMLNKNMLLTGDIILKQWKIEGDNLVLISKNEKAHDKNQINFLLNLGDGHVASCSDDCSIKIW